MKRFPVSGIRTRLLMFFAVVVVPIFLFIVFNYWEERSRAIERSKAQASALCQLSVVNEQTVLQETQELLARFSALPAVTRRNKECADYLSSALKNHPRYILFGVTDSAGNVICSTLPGKKTINVADRSYFKNAVETGSFSVGTYQVGRFFGTSSLIYSYPILDKAKKDIGGIVFAERDITNLLDFETDLSLFTPPQSSFAKIDGSGTVLSNFPDSPDLPIGKSVGEGLFGKILSEKQGSAVLEGVDGEKRLYLFSTLQVTPYGEKSYILLGIPMKSLFAEASRDLFWFLGILCLAAMIAVGGMWIVGRRLIIRPVEKIIGTAGKLAEGDLSARTGMGGEDNEIGYLGSVIDDMARELERKSRVLEEQTVTLEEQAAKLKEQASLLSVTGKKLSHVLSASPAVIYALRVLDPRKACGENFGQELKATYVSENVREIFGWDAQELMGSDGPWWLKDIHPEDLSKSMDMKEVFEKGSASREYRIKTGQDTYRWGFERMVLVRDESGEPVEIVGSWMDITERKQYEESLSLLGMAVGQAAEGIVITDTEGNYVYANPAFEKISGYSLEELVGKSYRIFDGDKNGEEHYRKIRKSLREGKAWKGRTANKRKDGSCYEADVTVSPVWGAAGKIVNYVACTQDVTRESVLQKQLQNAQRLESVGVLAGGIAHDFNNSLTGIFGFTELAMLKSGGNEEVRSCLGQVEKSARSAANLTRQLLAYSRRQIMSTVNLNLNNVIADLLRLIGKVAGEKIWIKTVFETHSPIVKADVGQIEQVLMNLVINARDAMPDGGNILIETNVVDLTDRQDLPYPGFVPGKYVSLRISDTGAGMDEETKARVFDPFFTTKTPDKGTGLGLSVVYGIVKQHEGFIGVQSEPGKGTSFEIHLPAVESVAEAETTRKVRAEKVLGGTETILLVEDDAVVRLIAGETLKSFGYTVLEAMNGEEGLKVFRRNRDRISLALLDIVMPVMGGIEAYDEMIQAGPNLKAIFMSGHSEPVAQRSFAHGLKAAFLSKPFTPNELARKVREVLSADNAMM